ncbi:MAG: DUF1553 domain-containing protein [Planctomycetaceae bacterium]
MARSAAAGDGGNWSAVASIFERNCVSCHQGDRPKGGLSLVNATQALRGGDSGTVIVPGRPDESLLLDLISGEMPEMPQKARPLPARQVAEIRRWIEQGAPWPENVTLTDRKLAGADDDWWCFRPLVRPEVPVVDSDWVRTPVDAFVLAKRQLLGLPKSPEADRRTLIRRLTYDLHGLPPTPNEVAEFLADTSPDAFDRLIDRLLDSRRYGERWGRHWLDVIHYGESHGYDKDKPRPNAWPYRDYVIAAFNDDKPYWRFVAEQLAGDVLYPDDWQGVVATGFIAAGPWDYVGHAELREGTLDKKITRSNDRDDMVATAATTFLSLTAHCARCHNHKFDPISQEDYYRLQAVFAGVDRADRPFDEDPATHRQRSQLLHERAPLAARQRLLAAKAAETVSPEIRQIDERIAGLRKELAPLGAKDERRAAFEKSLQEQLTAREAAVARSLDDATRNETEAVAARLSELEQQLSALGQPQWVYAGAHDFTPLMTFTPAVTPRPVFFLYRGSDQSPGREMEPGALSCLEKLPAVFELGNLQDEGARRAALAKWIIDPHNPLTCRSIVNRVWQYHFGRGIVETPNDFGHMGSKPTHPELLDWLAVEFAERGWSLKRLHKLILKSAVYRQSSQHDPAAAEIDAGNQYLWRMNRQRLEAEAIHDAVLAISGRLDLTMRGPSVRQFWFKDDHSPVYDYERFDIDSADARRRSVYRFIVRSVPDPFMECLDAADPSLLTPRRNTTLTALQALSLLNNRFMVRHAEHFATRVRAISQDPAEQVDAAYELALGRAPHTSEWQALVKYIDQHGLENACRLILNCNEFIFVD